MFATTIAWRMLMRSSPPRRVLKEGQETTVVGKGRARRHVRKTCMSSLSLTGEWEACWAVVLACGLSPAVRRGIEMKEKRKGEKRRD
jgi:hypothetical protein